MNEIIKIYDKYNAYFSNFSRISRAQVHTYLNIP